ncbi:MAG: DUF2064 domain-containing protein [Acidimicrobiia bacterium]|nr:DUF2064 domain-containing protein [Acidimicrobiia bacterium]
MSAARARTHLTVVAKAPVPGRVKTRLCPPCTPEQAALVAAACLQDTLEAAAACRADEVVLALDGDGSHRWVPPSVRVIDQGTGALADRLCHTWETTGTPGLQIGMDTPQVTPELLDDCLDRLAQPGIDAVLGPASDGGWWAIGLTVPCTGAFAGIPTGRHDTGERQHRRLLELGLRVELLPVLRDVDDLADARAVAADAPDTSLAAVLHTLEQGWA